MVFSLLKEFIKYLLHLSLFRVFCMRRQLDFPFVLSKSTSISIVDGIECFIFIFRNPLAQMEEEKREHDLKMKKMESEMEQVRISICHVTTTQIMSGYRTDVIV